MRSSLSSEKFFRIDVRMEEVSRDWKVAVERERLTILQIVGG